MFYSAAQDCDMRDIQGELDYAYAHMGGSTSVANVDAVTDKCFPLSVKALTCICKGHNVKP
jgi:hypothetical protein